MIVEGRERESALLRVPASAAHKPPPRIRLEEVTPTPCVNLDPHAAREGLVEVGAEPGLPPAFSVQDLLAEGTDAWRTGGNDVRVDPGGALVLQIR